MVKLTLDLISRCTSGYTKRKQEESLKAYLKRLTHLYLEDKNIDEIEVDDLHLCRNLTVLYLYDNKLIEVPKLQQNQNLTHLYLQNNFIPRMINLSYLPKLQKLYIGGNKICVVEGLEKLYDLQELHVENQQLPPGETLVFDPRSINAIAHSLQVLNVSGNNMDSISMFVKLESIMQFLCSENQLADFQDLGKVLGSWNHLWRLELNGNPICQQSNKYRERIIVMCCPSLKVFDGKEVKETSKTFLKSLKNAKEARKKREDTDPILNSSYKTWFEHIKTNCNTSKDDSKILILCLRYMMQGFRRSKQFDDVLARSYVTSGTVKEEKEIDVVADINNYLNSNPDTLRSIGADESIRQVQEYSSLSANGRNGIARNGLLEPLAPRQAFPDSSNPNISAELSRGSTNVPLTISGKQDSIHNKGLHPLPSKSGRAKYAL